MRKFLLLPLKPSLPLPGYGRRPHSFQTLDGSGVARGRIWGRTLLRGPASKCRPSLEPEPPARAHRSFPAGAVHEPGPVGDWQEPLSACLCSCRPSWCKVQGQWALRTLETPRQHLWWAEGARPPTSSLRCCDLLYGIDINSTLLLYMTGNRGLVLHLLFLF